MRAEPPLGAFSRADAGNAWERVATKALGFVFAAAVRTVAATWRVRAEGVDALFARVAARRRTLVAFWHGSHVALLALLRGRGGLVVTSRSFRGSIVAAIARRLGFREACIPEREPRIALEIVRAALGDAMVVAVAADGPLGPSRAVKRGVVALASELGLELAPLAVDARPSLVLASRWDRLALPVPFARVSLVAGDAFEVARPGTAADERAAEERVGAAIEEAAARARLP